MASGAHDAGRKVLISGAGIAGLTLGILLKEHGWEPLVVERDPVLRTEGYMMDFFGAGWDVAERMGLVDAIRAIHYPVDRLEYVDGKGNPLFPPVPLDRVRRALGGKYAPLRRPDLALILLNRASASGVQVRFGTTVHSIEETGSGLKVTLSDGTVDEPGLVFGADGVHSRVRELIFGPEAQFDRFLGYYAAGFHIPIDGRDPGHSLKIYEEPGRVLWCYPIDDRTMDAMYFFSHGDVGRLPREKRLTFVREQYKGAGWITGSVLRGVSGTEQIYFDAMTQIVMPTWHKGRVALVGDACGCLTPLAGQGSHMAMAGAYVLARELERYSGDHRRAFAAYESYLKPAIARKQDDALRSAPLFIPSSQWQMPARYLLLRMMYSKWLIRLFFSWFGAKSVLTGYE
jgi:2-polyprenyl-6-methoxyphenol hydroxylase-like FAD-dependent oxidoreductase